MAPVVSNTSNSSFNHPEKSGKLLGLGPNSKTRIKTRARRKKAKACRDPMVNLQTQGSEESLDFKPWTNAIYMNGQLFVVSIGIMVGSEYLPIIDKDGLLLGEFSKLDDLSVCDEDILNDNLVMRG